MLRGLCLTVRDDFLVQAIGRRARPKDDFEAKLFLGGLSLAGAQWLRLRHPSQQITPSALFLSPLSDTPLPLTPTEPLLRLS